jgi:hypothetical protein
MERVDISPQDLVEPAPAPPGEGQLGAERGVPLEERGAGRVGVSRLGTVQRLPLVAPAPQPPLFDDDVQKPSERTVVLRRDPQAIGQSRDVLPLAGTSSAKAAKPCSALNTGKRGPSASASSSSGLSSFDRAAGSRGRASHSTS